jgi:uncharacterized RDD family membrane protein YckC
MKNNSNNSATSCNSCSFLRRLGCLIYDTVIVAAIWMLAGLPVVLANDGPVSAQTLWFQTYLFSVTGLYFVWSWRQGGQTVGMRAWRVYVVDINTLTESEFIRPSLRACLIRYVSSYLSTAVVAVGWLWSLGHPQSMTWHDLLSGTRLVTKRSAKKQN